MPSCQMLKLRTESGPMVFPQPTTYIPQPPPNKKSRELVRHPAEEHPQAARRIPLAVEQELGCTLGQGTAVPLAGDFPTGYTVTGQHRAQDQVHHVPAAGPAT